jgi:hypothetical protein
MCFLNYLNRFGKYLRRGRRRQPTPGGIETVTFAGGSSSVVEYRGGSSVGHS